MPHLTLPHIFPLFLRIFDLLPSPFPPALIHDSSISCDVPEFSPLPLSRTLEKGAFLQSAVTVSSSIASQEALLELCRSSTHALPQLHHASVTQVYSCHAILYLTYHLLISRQKGILPIALCSTTHSCSTMTILCYIN